MILMAAFTLMAKLAGLFKLHLNFFNT